MPLLNKRNVLAAVVLLGLAACGEKKSEEQTSSQQPATVQQAAVTPAPAPASTPAGPTVLTRGIGSTIGTLDPQVNFLAYEGWIQDDMYEGLVDLDAQGQVVPGAAERWEISDDGMTYTFHLRDGLKWSNGDKLVAQDFVNAVIRTIKPETASEKNYIFSSTISVAGAAEFMDTENKDPASKDPKNLGISAPDEKTVVLKLTKPAPYTLLLMYSFYLAPLHTPSLEKFGKDFIKPENIVNNGAYKMTENVPQSHVTLEKNPNYWDAANVKIDKVVYQISEDDQTAVKLFKTGAQDITYDIPSDQIDALKAEFGDQVHIAPSTEVLYLSFDLKKPPFDNIKLRQALSTAIDRDVLVNKVVKGGYLVNCGYSIPGVEGYAQPQLPECGMKKEEREALAKKLYAEAGFGPDKKLSLKIESSNNESYKKMWETIAVMWKQTLGVDATVNAQDRDSWLAAFTAGGWDVFGDDLVGDFAGPETFLAYMDPRAEAGYNWESKEYEASWDKAMSMTNQADRYKELAVTEKALLDTYVTAPVAAAPNRNLVNKRVKGWTDNPGAIHGSKYMWIE